MHDLKVADEEHESLAERLISHGKSVQETLETFIGAMRGVRQVGVEDGAFAERMDVFILQVELSASKPGEYAEELSHKLKAYLSEIDKADEALY